MESTLMSVSIPMATDPEATVSLVYMFFLRVSIFINPKQKKVPSHDGITH